MPMDARETWTQPHAATAQPTSLGWFDRALAVEPERSLVSVGEARIEMLTWGERGRPGLLLVPGMCAHADWWSFIAPMLLPDYRVAALSLSGMGSSSWRDAYRYVDTDEELFACARAAGLYDCGAAPVFVGHSYGGWAVFHFALRHRKRLQRGILLDTAYNNRGPADRVDHSKPPPRSAAAPSYASLDEAVKRFRFFPDQKIENHYIGDFIARRSFKRVTAPDGREVWTSRTDPEIFQKLDSTGFPLQNWPAPLVHLIGSESVLMARTDGDQPPLLRNYMRSIKIPGAGHHIMVDQPLALVTAMRQILASPSAAR